MSLAADYLARLDEFAETEPNALLASAARWLCADWRSLDALRCEIADKGIDSVTAEPRPGGGWRHTRIEAHADHDVRWVTTFVPPDQSGKWERVKRSGEDIVWRHRGTGKHAKTPVVVERQTRTVGPWVDEGQQGLGL